MTKITKDDPLRDEGHDKADQESALSDDRTATGLRRRQILEAAINQTPIPLSVILHRVWRELCSLVSRIAILRRNNWFPRGVSLDHFAQGCYVQYPLRCKYRRARIRGIQKALSIHPMATLVDFHILVSAIDPQLLQEDSDMANEKDYNHR